MSLFSKIFGIGSTIAGVATGNPVMALGGISSLATKDAKSQAAVPAANPASFLNLDVSGIDPNFKYPEGYQPTTVRAPILGDIATYTAKNYNPTLGEQQGQQQLLDSRVLLESILNPESDLNKRLSASATQVARGDFLRNLRDAQAMDRKARSAGKPSLFGDSRGDENVSRMLMENAQSANLQGRSNANALLNQAFGNSTNLASGFSDLANTQQKRRTLSDESNRYAIEQQRNDARTRNTQQRSDIYSMLNAADPQRSIMQKNQGQLVSDKNAENADLIRSAMDFARTPKVNNYLSDLFNQGTNYVFG